MSTLVYRRRDPPTPAPDDRPQLQRDAASRHEVEAFLASRRPKRWHLLEQSQSNRSTEKEQSMQTVQKSLTPAESLCARRAQLLADLKDVDRQIAQLGRPVDYDARFRKTLEALEKVADLKERATKAKAILDANRSNSPEFAAAFNAMRDTERQISTGASWEE